MRRWNRLIASWVLALAAAAPLAAQATFEIPSGLPNTDVFRPQELPKEMEEEEEKPVELRFAHD